jgi:hypothetical protein
MKSKEEERKKGRKEGRSGRNQTDMKRRRYVKVNKTK